MEREADHDGARYASGAGYDPHGLSTFFQKLEASGAGGALPTFLSSHPANSDRIADVNAQISAEQLKGTELGVAGLKAAQAQLGKK
jgi:predicted Zn-dependent protease